jgi:hypothetical protein
MQDQTLADRFVFLVICGVFAIAPLALVPTLSSATISPERKIVLIGLDAVKNSVSNAVPAAIYERDLSVAMSAVQTSVIPVLNRRELKTQPIWRLDSVGVGIGVSGSLGLGPIINVSVSPQLKLIFSNRINPTFPD